jgi:hypothetical protein
MRAYYTQHTNSSNAHNYIESDYGVYLEARTLYFLNIRDNLQNHINSKMRKLKL